MDSTDVPWPGLGTSGVEGEECTETVERALAAGYRHVDTAQMYDNEGAVGAGLAAADVDREDVFLATKVHPGNLARDDVLATAEESLDRLGLSAVDLLYVHWPMRAYDPAETLPAIDELYAEGLTRAVGISNFTPELLDEAHDVLDAPIAAHQVECHPYLQQDDLLERARDDGHALVAYSPLAQGDVVDDPTLSAVAAEHDATAAQVALAWLADRGPVVPIPQGRGDHVEENLAARDLDLTDADRERIAALDEGRRLIDPDDAAWN
jgi:2,5-diketo-D-gluconate reductase B